MPIMSAQDVQIAINRRLLQSQTKAVSMPPSVDPIQRQVLYSGTLQIPNSKQIATFSHVVVEEPEEEPEEEVQPSATPTGYEFVPLKRGFQEIADLFMMLSQTAPGAVIAGGYARYCASPDRKTSLPADIDIFVPDYITYNNVATALTNAGFLMHQQRQYSSVWEGPYANQGDLPINLVMPEPLKTRTLSSKSVTGLLDGFPFPVTRAVIVSPTEVMVSTQFMFDETNKQLTMDKITDPVTALRHAFKYARKGYHISEASILAAMDAYAGTTPEYKEEVREGKTLQSGSNYIGPISSWPGQQVLVPITFTSTTISTSAPTIGMLQRLKNAMTGRVLPGPEPTIEHAKKGLCFCGMTHQTSSGY